MNDGDLLADHARRIAGCWSRGPDGTIAVHHRGPMEHRSDRDFTAGWYCTVCGGKAATVEPVDPPPRLLSRTRLHVAVSDEAGPGTRPPVAAPPPHHRPHPATPRR